MFVNGSEDLASMLGVLALSFAVLWVLCRRAFQRRLEALVRAAERLAAGEDPDPEAQLTPAQSSRLTAAFRVMSQRAIESERRFRSIWENSLEPLRLTDAEGNVLAANPSYCRMMERPLEEIQGRPFTAVYQDKGAEEKLARYVDAFRNRTFARHQTKRVTLMSGRSVDIEVSYSFVEMESDKPLLLAIFRDVSERMAFIDQLNNAKEFSENLIKTATVMIVAVDAGERITIFNEAAEQLTGLSKAEVQGTPWNRLLGSAEETAVRLGAAGHRSTFESKLITKSNEERIISWQTNAILENGHPVGIICFGTDITETRRQEEDRRALERKMLDAQKLESLGILAGGIAHDFNNLLAAILGNANLAQLKLPPAQSEIAGYLKNVEKTSMRAADLCRQLLAYSGKARFSMQVLDLNEVVRETLELLEVSITKKAALRVELRHGLACALADPTQLRQVIMNLVINASEAMGDRSGLIRVRTGSLEADADYFADAHGAEGLSPGEYVFVEVIDNGSGMSPETQKRIFDPFFTTKFTGRGLGLAAVLGIVRGHNGALKLSSSLGKGSAFKFLLPSVPSSQEAPGAGPRGSLDDWRGSGTILVVDDDPTVRAVLARMVEAFGFAVLQAVDGRHGVDVFQDNQDNIRAVVLDMTMPNLNGREAIEHMRRIRRDVPVLLVSGFTENCASGSFGKGNPNAFLQKPFNPEELKLKLRAILN